MNRFAPDTLREWLLRPFAMAAPDGWVYVEICAPDFRFLIVALLVAMLLLGRRPGRPALPGGRPLLAVGVLTAISFVPWLATTANGRYFIPYLILVGPLCIGLAARLPLSASMRGFAVVLVMGLQGFAVWQNSPWKPFDTWEWLPWREAPYFHVDTTPVQGDTDVTYVTLPVLTLALMYPQFPDTVRWVNLSTFQGAELANTDHAHYRRAEAMLDGGKLRLLHRTQPAAMDPVTMMPQSRAVNTLNRTLAPHRLALREPLDCKFLRSRHLSMVTMVMSDSGEEPGVVLDRAGFWSCALERTQTRPGPPPPPTAAELLAMQVFSRMEQLCPRFFAPGQHRPLFNGTIYFRPYHGSDFTLMMATNAELWVKYERALNPELVAPADKVLQPDFKLDCNAFQGRAGLPWERKI